MLRTLYLDTSGSILSAACFAGSEKVSEHVIEDSRTGEHVTSLLHQVLSKADWSSESVEKLVVCHGPGSFTGLRNGVSAALGFSFAANCKVQGVSSFVAAIPASPSTGILAICLPASKVEHYLALAKFKEVTSSSKPVVTLGEPVVIGISETEKAIAETGSSLGADAAHTYDVTTLVITSSESGCPAADIATRLNSFIFKDQSSGGVHLKSGTSGEHVEVLYLKAVFAKTLAERGKVVKR